mmetsp:Transcript_29900/g.88879  ORF Transcript_29900/g.88879 Transcript_29900/m.88879 type:complete len:276 (+) Transcript_29900:1205-2032(+)
MPSFSLARSATRASFSSARHAILAVNSSIVLSFFFASSRSVRHSSSILILVSFSARCCPPSSFAFAFPWSSSASWVYCSTVLLYASFTLTNSAALASREELALSSNLISDWYDLHTLMESAIFAFLLSSLELSLVFLSMRMAFSASRSFVRRRTRSASAESLIAPSAAVSVVFAASASTSTFFFSSSKSLIRFLSSAIRTRLRQFMPRRSPALTSTSAASVALAKSKSPSPRAAAGLLHFACFIATRSRRASSRALSMAEESLSIAPLTLPSSAL